MNNRIETNEDFVIDKKEYELDKQVYNETVERIDINIGRE